MAEWKQIYFNDCEAPFYDVEVDGVIQTELTIPTGMNLHWLDGNNTPGVYHRPEMDVKKVPQPEVYEGLQSATGFVINSTGRFGLVSDRIPINNDKLIRAFVKYMHVFNFTDNDPQGGSRLGIVMGDGPFNDLLGPKWLVDPFQDNNQDILWGPWKGYPRGDDPGVPNRKWVSLEVPSHLILNAPYIRLVTQFNSDFAVDFSGAHWDNWVVEQYTEEVEPPNPPDPPDPSNLGDQIRAKTMEMESIISDLNIIASQVDELMGNSEARGDVEDARDLLDEALGKM